jgi:hypothetical protein
MDESVNGDLTGSSFLQVPVVLVGNKIDLRGNDVSNKCLEDEVVPLMNEFKVRGLAFWISKTLSLTMDVFSAHAFFFTHHRKSRPVSSARQNSPSMYPKYSTLHKRLFFIPQRPCMTLGNMF